MYRQCDQLSVVVSTLLNSLLSQKQIEENNSILKPLNLGTKMLLRLLRLRRTLIQLLKIWKANY